MSEPHLEDFIKHRLKNIYHDNEDEKLLVLEFDNDYKLMIRGVGDPTFIIRKERISEESKEEKKAKEKEKKKALSERRAKESKQKNRKKDKS